MTHGVQADIRRAPAIPARDTRLEAWAALVLAVVWPLVTVVCVALEPAAAGDGGTAGAVLGTGYLALLVATMGAAAQRSRTTVALSFVTGGVAAAMTLTCPLSGHHPVIGLWWAGQWAAVVGGLLVTAVVLGRRRA